MCKRLLLSLSVLVFVSSTAAANVFWQGGSDTDWSNGSNWAGGVPSTSADWADIRNDNWVQNFPVIPALQTVDASVIRIGPNFGGVPQTGTITMDGGTLNLQQEMYIGETAVSADFVMNSGLVNVGLAGLPNNSFTAVGTVGGTGRILMNGGTFNAGTLGLPKWWETVGTGNAIIDGGNLITNGIIIDGNPNGSSPTSGIDFTKDLASGGGLLTDTQDLADPNDWINWQAQVGNWIDAGIISSSTGGAVQAKFSSVGTIRTSEIFSVAAVPGDFNGDLTVDGADFLLWQRGQTSPPLDPADLAIWEANYGTVVVPLGAVTSAVPEPASIVLVAFGMVALATRRRLRGLRPQRKGFSPELICGRGGMGSVTTANPL